MTWGSRYSPQPMAYLTIRIKGQEGYSRSPLDKDRLTLGRSSSSDIQVKTNSLSREHLVITREGTGDQERWFVEDLGSSNGTRIGDIAILGKTGLSEADVIKAGAARMTFHLGAISTADEAKERRSGPMAPVVKRGENDPVDAAACLECARWYSIAHRLAGDRMACPHCGKSQIVPEFAA